MKKKPISSLYKIEELKNSKRRTNNKIQEKTSILSLNENLKRGDGKK
jgi:hypothetical protein